MIGRGDYNDEPMAPDGYERMSSTNRRRWRRASAGAGLLALVALGACEGDNLFSGDSLTEQPRVSVSGPDFIEAGDSFQVRVDGVARRGIARVDVALRGAMSRDTSITITGGATATSTSQVLKFGAPNFLADTVVVISARVTDVAGRSGAVRADTVAAFGPPGVVTVSRPDSVRAGQVATVRVRALGSRRITQLNVSVRGAMTLDSTIAVVPPRFDVTQDLAFTVPATANDTLLRVAVTARDEAGLTGVPLNVNVPLSVSIPVATLLDPPTSAAPGGTLTLRVRGTSARGVARLRAEVQGTTLGVLAADSTISPAANDVTRSLTIAIPATVQDANLTVRVYAIDRAGVSSAASTTASTATIPVPQGVPVILSLSSADQTRGGQNFDVRVVARGVRPLSQVTVRFRGAVNQELVIPVNPQRTDATVDASVAIPLVVADTQVTVTATATDISGAISPISTRTARVTDVTPPTVAAAVNPGQASAGRNVSIRVTASDNVGISRFGFAALTAAGDTVGITPTLATTRGLSRDSVFTFAVPASLTPTTLRVVGIAFDAQGLRSVSAAANLVVVDSAMPAVNISDPIDGSSFPLTGQVLVRARVADASGIRRVTFRGVAIRRDSATDARVVDRFTPVVVTFPQPPSVSLPRDTTLVRFLTPVAGDNTAEIVNIVVEAIDSVGNVATDTNRVTVGGPTVELRNPVNGSSVSTSGTFQITAQASDPTAGLDSMKVYLTGVITDSIVVKGLNGATTRLIDVPYTVGTTTGVVNVVARAWNRTRIQGASTSSAITITSTAVTDTQAPQVVLLASVPSRVEVNDDTISLTVRAQDLGPSGVARLGVVLVATPDSVDAAVSPVIRQDTFYVDRTYAPARAGGIEEIFRISLDDFLAEEVAGTPRRFDENGRLRFPRIFRLEAHAFAIDAVGNCGATVSATPSALTCVAAATAGAGTTFRVATGTTGFILSTTAVLGQSVRLPNGGRIADALVDPRRPKLYMSNIALNRIEYLDLTLNCFEGVSACDTALGVGGRPATFGLVGSSPWGLSFNANLTCTVAIGCGAFVGPAASDTLIVANSGGTNLSFVPLDGAARGVEHTVRRLNTPNSVLFNVFVGTTNALIDYDVRFLDFSDRPQFIGVRSDNIITYSTVPTGSAPDGTIRFVDPNPNPGAPPNDNRPEVKLLVNRSGISEIGGVVAIANIDSVAVTVDPATGNEVVELFDHLPGRWDNLPSPTCFLVPPPTGLTTLPRPWPTVAPPAGTRCIRSGAYQIGVSIAQIERAGSDIRDFNGSWNQERIGMSDTTFVAVSDDRSTVVFGEGATAPTGRVIACCTRNYTPPTPAPPQGLVLGISGEISVRDLINNASERVLGVGLNNNGTLGIARGQQASYFFTPDLRLQGQFNITGVSGGAALHPEHTSVLGTGAGASDAIRLLAFVPTGVRTIKIINTVHFFEVGEIPIRDNIVGPLRAVRPYAADNAGVPAGDRNEVVVKLVGVSENAQVVIINVRRKDIAGA